MKPPIRTKIKQKKTIVELRIPTFFQKKLLMRGQKRFWAKELW